MPGMLQPALLRLKPAKTFLFVVLPLGALLSGCATDAPIASAPKTSEAPPRVVVAPKVNTPEHDALRALVALQDRLYRVAAPLLVNNTELCRGNARNLLGFTAKNKYSYSADYVEAAQTAFGLEERLQVMGVLPGSGAAKAGVRRGDGLLSVEDKVLPQGPNAEGLAPSILGPLLSKGPSSVKLSVERSGANMILNVPLTHACAFSIELGNTDNVNAYADGHRVMITRGMMQFAQADDELAYVLAKEIAHNALAHADKQRMSATVGGIIDNLTRVHPDMSSMVGAAGVKAATKELDAAADVLALYMLARAGYGIDGAPQFWQRLAGQYSPAVLTGYTAIHPATAYRISVINKTIPVIKTKQAEKKPLVPDSKL